MPELTRITHRGQTLRTGQPLWFLSREGAWVCQGTIDRIVARDDSADPATSLIASGLRLLRPEECYATEADAIGAAVALWEARLREAEALAEVARGHLRRLTRSRAGASSTSNDTGTDNEEPHHSE